MRRNIVCFPEKMDLNILGKILQGGAEKVLVNLVNNIFRNIVSDFKIL